MEKPIQFTFKSLDFANRAVLIAPLPTLEERFPNGLTLSGIQYSLEDLKAIDDDAFWDGLPQRLTDHDVRVERIKELFPITYFTPDPRVNRRKLYEKYIWLRTESMRGWKHDEQVDRFSKVTVPPSWVLHSLKLNNALAALEA